jgi:hypothetical protein
MLNLFKNTTKKPTMTAKFTGEDISPESVVTHPNFNLIEGVLFGAVEITPDMAQLWLLRNKNIRRLQESKLSLFAEAMSKDQWDLNGESIKFDKDGNLVDGQNRLTACVKANKSFTSAVAFGIDSAINVDRGKPRTVGQIIQAQEFAYDANAMSAMINYLHAYKDEGSAGFVTVGHGRHPLTLDDALRTAKENQQDLNYSIRATNKVKKIFNRYSLHAALHYLFCQTAGTALADQFYEGLITGLNLSSSDPVYHLREKLMKLKNNQIATPINAYAGMIIKGWNYFITGRSISNFKYTYAVDGVPEIKRSPLSR